MKSIKKPLIVLILIVALCCPAGVFSLSVNDSSTTLDYLKFAIPQPTLASIGGEWTVIGMARQVEAGGAAWKEKFEEFVQTYSHNALLALQEAEGQLSATKLTDYSRLILALTALGQSPEDFGGYNLLKRLSELNSLTRQGVNGPAYALLALDSGNYSIPKVASGGIQATREKMIEFILKSERKAGGFALSGETADPDVTAMCVQALARYRDRPAVSAAIDRSLTILMQAQTTTGSIAVNGIESCESTAQAILALTMLDINPETDSRFVKQAAGGQSLGLISGLNRFAVGNGSYRHLADGSADLMATEQALLALTAYERHLRGVNKLYQMSDARLAERPDGSAYAYKVMLNGKHLLFDQPPINVNSRVLVPMRAIFEALDAEVRWDPVKRRVSALLGNQIIQLTIDSKTAAANGRSITLDSAPVIVNGRTLVPIRFVAESLQAKVNWSGETNTVIILKK